MNFQGLKGLDPALLNQPGMTPEMLQIMQMSLGGAPPPGLAPSASPSPRNPAAKELVVRSYTYLKSNIVELSGSYRNG